MHTLEAAMKHVIPGELHVVVAERQDQVTGVMYTRKPHEHLVTLASATQLGRIEVRPSAYAPRVVESLARRFVSSTTEGSAASFWTLADFEELLAALDEYDLDRGILVERAGVKINAPVYVPKVGRGTVRGFTPCGRVIVRLTENGKPGQTGVIAPRSQVKPVISAAMSVAMDEVNRFSRALDGDFQ
jgi:hypothetical protein